MSIRIQTIVRRHRGKTLLAVCLLAVPAVFYFWPAAPEARFRAVTGRDLPAGVHAIAYAGEQNDSLFHTTHYWLLSGSPSALRRVKDQTGFIDSLEDARWMLPDVKNLFGVCLSSKDLIAGYEREDGRDRWFWIFGDGTTAIYAY
jgi:hypothetical protein